MTPTFKVGSFEDRVHPALASFVLVCATIIIFSLAFIVLNRGDEVLQGIRALTSFN